MLRIKILILLFLSVIIYSCSENPVVATDEYRLVYQELGLIDSLGGDCSGVEVRTSSLDFFDLTEYESLRFEFMNSTDTDLSSVQIFYVDSLNVRKDLVFLERMSISHITHVDVPSPKVRKELFLRLTLKSSECTGHIYHLTVRDLKMLVK